MHFRSKSGLKKFVKRFAPYRKKADHIFEVAHYRVLLLLGHINEESRPECPLTVSQSALAEMVGTTRARVSKFMNGFRKKGFVRYNGGMQINSALITSFLRSRPMSVATKT